MKYIHILINLLIIFYSCFGELGTSELEALNILSNAWNLEWDPDDTGCPGNRNEVKHYITCIDDKIIELYLLKFNSFSLIIILYFINRNFSGNGILATIPDVFGNSYFPDLEQLFS